MEVYRISSRLFLLLGLFCLVTTLQGVQGGVESEGPSESECRPYIEKALKELETAEAADPIAPGDSGGESKEEEDEATEEVEVEVSTVEITTDDSDHAESDGDNDIEVEESRESNDSAAIDESKEEADDDHSVEERSAEEGTEEASSEHQLTSAESETEDAVDDEQSVEEHEEESKDHEESDESPQFAEVEEITVSEEERSVEEKEEDGSDDTDDKSESAETNASAEDRAEDVHQAESAEDDKSIEADQESVEAVDEDGAKSEEDEEKPQGDEPETEEDRTESAEAESAERTDKKSSEEEAESAEGTIQESAEATDQESAEATDQESAEAAEQESAEATEQESAEATDQESAEATEQESAETAEQESTEEQADVSTEDDKSVDQDDATASTEEGQSAEDPGADIVHEGGADETEDGDSKETAEDAEATSDGGSKEDDKSREADDRDASEEAVVKEDDSDNQVQTAAEASEETVSESDDVMVSEKEEEKPQGDEPQSEEETKGEEENDGAALEEMAGQDGDSSEEKDQEHTKEEDEKEFTPEEELINEGEIPENLRPIDHIWQLLKLDDDNLASEKIINGVAEITLRELKKLYENAIKPLETLYKYRDLSNRHFGDAEIFSKPLVLFMGPWSGGKSSIINYLLNNEYNETSLRTGAEPSPAYFNILMYGEEPEVLDGTQLAADFTFSGLQKFGQGLEERLRGLKLPQKLLQKINIVEIPGILEVRKQISRVFPFNDACQWFIDRADIIHLVYDPSKLDVGPETEAILDQLKGREHQTRMILNKADQVKPEELMRVQGALIWNISPLMSSAQPPVMYTTSLWSKPYELGAPVRLLQAQERAFLRDLRSAFDKRIENKIASARRFAVRVRNHAKMVDCYLTTYYNHKSVFGNRKQVSDAIIEHPQDYHIYEGLSTLTNISRYDLPDPDVYRDFFRLNALYDFQQLSATCTYFRGCPINRLDVAIAYDLPELVGKHKRMIDAALNQANLSQTPGS